jgi:tetratricopeptide (TPR) repeat protein
LAWFTKFLEQDFSKNHPYIGDAYSYLGVIYCKKGDYVKALEYHNESLSIVKQTLGESHLHDIYGNIANCYYHLRQYDKAIENNEKVIKIRNEVFGANSPVTADGYTNLGSCYDSLGDCSKAIEIFQKALSIRIKFHGSKKKFGSAVILNNIGNCYRKTGEYDKAIECAKEAMEILTEFIDINHPEIAVVQTTLGSCYQQRGESDEALQYFKKALLTKIKVHGAKHPDVLALQQNIKTCKTHINVQEKRNRYVQQHHGDGDNEDEHLANLSSQLYASYTENRESGHKHILLPGMMNCYTPEQNESFERETGNILLPGMMNCYSHQAL